MPGFVHDRASHAIVANWVGADGIWQVDVTDRPPALREYGDAADYTTTHSPSPRPHPHGRLRAWPDYLGPGLGVAGRPLPELAEYGTAGIAQPRSRLLVRRRRRPGLPVPRPGRRRHQLGCQTHRPTGSRRPAPWHHRPAPRVHASSCSASGGTIAMTATDARRRRAHADR